MIDMKDYLDAKFDGVDKRLDKIDKAIDDHDGETLKIANKQGMIMGILYTSGVIGIPVIGAIAAAAFSWI